VSGARGPAGRVTHPALAVARLFPPGVVASEVRGGVAADGLFPAERECVARAAPSRVEEFAAGRLCARTALSALGFPESPLLCGPDRAPLWPPGATGSISHTDGYCVAVVGATRRFAGLGADAEHVGRPQRALWRIVFADEEVKWLDGLAESERPQMATVIFSAKEAFYKCLYPITRAWLGFGEVTVRVAGNSFQATLCEDSTYRGRNFSPLTGQFVRLDDLIVCAVAIVS